MLPLQFIRLLIKPKHTIITKSNKAKNYLNSSHEAIHERLPPDGELSSRSTLSRSIACHFLKPFQHLFLK